MRINEQSRRRRHRLDRGDAGSCAPRLDFTDPYYRAPARFVSRRDAVDAETCGRKSSRARRSASSPAPRTRPISRRCSPTPSCRPIRTTTRCAQALRRGEVDFMFGDAIALAFWLNGTDSGDCCAFSRRALRREPLFRRGHRHRRAQGQRPAAPGAELGAVPDLGERPLHRSVAALFPDQPVLSRASLRGAQRRSISTDRLASLPSRIDCRLICILTRNR